MIIRIRRAADRTIRIMEPPSDRKSSDEINCAKKYRPAISGALCGRIRVLAAKSSAANPANNRNQIEGRLKKFGPWIQDKKVLVLDILDEHGIYEPSSVVDHFSMTAPFS